MSDQTQGHPHWQLMIEYGEDSKTDPEAWRGWEFREPGDPRWFGCNEHPKFYTNLEYRRKPRMCTLAGMEYPEPVKEPLKEGEEYWLVSIAQPKSPALHKWESASADLEWLKLRRIQRTREGAIAQGLAMIKAIGGEV